MGKDIGRLYKKIDSKLSTPTLKKPGLSSPASHTSSEGNSTQTYISPRLDNEHITTNQNKNNITTTYDIQSCVIPQDFFTVLRPLLRLLV